MSKQKSTKSASSASTKRPKRASSAKSSAISVKDSIEAKIERVEKVVESVAEKAGILPSRTLEKAVRLILVIGSILGLISAFVISYDKEQLLKNASFQPNCDLNPIISCGNVMKSAQGSVFGFPNPWVGLAAFGILLAVGMAMFAGATFKRWFWIALQLGTVFGLAFVHWLFFQSVYRIGALCPYCMVVWVVVITTFWYTLLYNIEQERIKLPASLKPAGRFARKHHLDILLVWFLIIFVLIMQHFWYFFGRPFGA